MTSTHRSSSSRHQRLEMPSEPFIKRLEYDHWWVVVAVASLISGIGGVLASPNAVGLAVPDAVFGFVVAAGLVPFFASARRWSWLVAAGLVALSSHDPLGVVFIVLGVIGAFAAVAAGGERLRIVGAVVGLLVIQAAFHQDDVLFHGAPAVIASVAMIAPVISGLAAFRRRTRRRILIGAGAVVLVVAIASAGFAVGAAGAWSDLRSARTASDQGFQALRDGEQDRAAELFDRAADDFSSAQSRLANPFTSIASVVPVLGPQVVAATTVSDAGAELGALATDAVQRARYTEVRASGGRIDLDQITDMQPVVDELVTGMATAQDRLEAADSAWLVPMVGDPLRGAIDQLDENLPQAELAADVLDVLPWLLGADDTRRYFVAFGNPAESRFLGGFVGGYGILEAAGGEVSFIESARTGQLGRPDARTTDLGLSPELANRYARWSPEVFLQNATVTPDFPTDAEMVRRLAPAYGIGPLDGVLYVDPIAIAALLELTGPVQVEGYSERISHENAAHLLLRDQYADLEREERNDLLSDVAEATFEALTERDLPGPGRVADVLGPMVAQGRLLFVTTDDDVNDVFDTIGLTGEFPRGGPGDFLSVRVANNAANKLDTYLARDVRYEVVYNARTGETNAALEIDLHNRAPDGLSSYAANNRALANGVPGAPPFASNVAYLSVYARLDLVGAQVNGELAAVEINPEFGHNTYSLVVAIPRGETRTVRMELTGLLFEDLYLLDVFPQPLVLPQNFTLTVRSPGQDGLEQVLEADEPPGTPPIADGAVPADGFGQEWTGIIEEPTRFLFGPRNDY